MTAPGRRMIAIERRTAVPDRGMPAIEPAHGRTRPRHDPIKPRMDARDRGMTAIEPRLAAPERRMTAIKPRLAAPDRRINAAKPRMDAPDRRMTAIERRSAAPGARRRATGRSVDAGSAAAVIFERDGYSPQSLQPKLPSRSLLHESRCGPSATRGLDDGRLLACVHAR
jgi:hypothetical protein